MLLKRELEDALMELNEHLEPGDKLAEIENAAEAVSQTDDLKKRFNLTCSMLLRLYKFVSAAEVGCACANTISAVRAVYNHINRKREAADTTELMVKLQEIVNAYINVEAGGVLGAEGGAAGGGAAAGVEGGARIAGGAGAGTSAVPCAPSPINENARFDISSIDFGRLSQEFAKAKHKHLIIDDLRGVIEARLDAAMKDNPLRIDFYKRYEKIIEGYNAEQDRAVIEKTFNDLMRLSSELDEKQKEWVRQGFQNQQQMTVFELLFKETLSPAEIKQVKAVAIDLVAEIDERLGQMVRWTEKEETVSQVKVIIRNAVYQLPEASYPDAALPGCIDQIFDYFYTRDAAA